MAGRLRVTLKKSTVGTNPSARGTVRALGLRRIGQTVELPDDPAVRGQIRAVRYLVECEEVAATAARSRSASKKKEEAEA
jgi:large subunit ribosomal protein L30